MDICHGNNFELEKQFTLFLVFEHIEQDLSSYLQRCPAPGLGLDKIKVRIKYVDCVVFIAKFLFPNRLGSNVPDYDWCRFSSFESDCSS